MDLQKISQRLTSGRHLKDLIKLRQKTRVFELTRNEFGGYDPVDAHNPDYFEF